MDDFQILRVLFKKEALACVKEKKWIILEERNNQNNQSYTLNITGIPEDIIAFKADMFPAPICVFKNTKHECRRADYVIIARDENRNSRRWIVYVEMKRGRGVTQDVELQLRGAKCLVAYCRAIGQEFWGKRLFLERYTEHFVSVNQIGISKRQTRQTRKLRSGVNMLSISAPSGKLPFNQLLGAASP